MHLSKKYRIVNRTLGASAVAAVLALSAAVSAQGPGGHGGHGGVQEVGPTYTPTGADFSITALQGIDSSNPLGQSGVNPQVDLNFEFNPSIGVAYDQGNGKLKDFGIGLYQNDGHGGPGGHNQQVESTGLMISYNTLVSASSASLTVEDFDLNNNATGFKPNKVTPSMLIFGANNTLIGAATPAEIFEAMVGQSSAKDTYDINMGTLLSDMHMQNQAISKVLLFADSSMGEKKSDPYLLQAVGNAKPVPEPASLISLGAAGLVFLRRRRSKTAS